MIRRTPAPKRAPIAFALATLGLGLLAGMALGPVSGRPARAEPGAESVRRTPVVRAVERVAPATVNITTEFMVQRPSNSFFPRDPFFERFFERAPDVPEQTLGTGVIVDGDGHVLTNEHVLAGAEKIWVSLVDGREFPGVLVGADPETDLAVLKIEGAEALPVAPLGRDGDLLIGETVIAIGNPFGLNHTVTTGVLSAINRSVRSQNTEYHGFLQTDASINPGNSGGPLLNLDGEVIGINTAILEGIGFAIPIERARRIMDDLINFGEVIPTWLGLWVREQSLIEGQASDSGRGTRVQFVFEDSPAAKAGIRADDVLLSLDGIPVQSSRNYFEILRGITEGDRAKVRVARGSKILELEVRAEALPVRVADDLSRLMLGFTLRPMTEAEARAYGRNGMVIAELLPGSVASRRLLPGDVIWAIGREPIPDQAALREVILKLRGRDRAILLVQRGRERARLALSLS